MSKSPMMTHDDNNRQEFKDQTRRRVYDALNPIVKKEKIKHSSTEMVTIKGLKPKD